MLLIPYVIYRSTYFSQLRLQQCVLKNVQVNTGPIDPGPGVVLGRKSAPMRVIYFENHVSVPNGFRVKIVFDNPLRHKT